MTDPIKQPHINLTDLMAEENDPKMRGWLALLNSIAENHRDGLNAVLTRVEKSEARSDRLEQAIITAVGKLDTHIDLLNKAKGAGWVTSRLVPFLLVLLTASVGFVRSEVSSLQASINQHGVSDAQLRTELVQAVNHAAVGDLRLASRIDVLDARCGRVEAMKDRAGK